MTDFYFYNEYFISYNLNFSCYEDSSYSENLKNRSKPLNQSTIKRHLTK